MSEPATGEIPAKKHQRLRMLFLGGTYIYMIFHMSGWYLFKWPVWGKTAMVGVPSLIAGRINSAAIMVILILTSIFFFGRFFCGWVCHLRGAIEFGDWFLKKMKFPQYKKIRDKNVLLNISLNPPLYWTLRIITLFVLIYPAVTLLFSGKAHLDLSPKPLRPMVDLPGYNDKYFGDKSPFNFVMDFSFLHVIMGAAGIFFILFVIGVVFTYFYGQGAFCRILCPYATIFAPLMNLNPFQTKITRVADCTGCRACSRSCPQGIDVSREIWHYDGKVINNECIKCYNCIDACDHGVLADTRKPAFVQITPRKEYIKKPWLNAERRLQVTEALSPAMDVISIIIGGMIGFMFARLGGFWYYVGAITGFVVFRKVSLMIKQKWEARASVRENKAPAAAPITESEVGTTTG
ncbi:MAG TPA: 4Fe-4S binding protein [Nitrospiria bacterium]|nr:4Fe-4S binding protein [Nitrospiria bacterium]